MKKNITEAIFRINASAILICCFLLYLFKDLPIRYSLPKIVILAAEIIACGLGYVCIVSDSSETLFSFDTVFDYIIASVMILCFLSAKGLTRLLLIYKELRLSLGSVAMIVPWLMSVVLNSEYSNSKDALGLLAIPFIMVGLFTFLCFAIESGNKKEDAVPQEDA